MEVKSFKSLGIRHIRDATDELVDYVDKRRKGLIKPLKTRWKKLNEYMPIDWHSLFVIAGISGSGKSSIANELETSLFDYNRDENFAVLSFNYEMTGLRQVGRKLSSKINKPVSEIYSNNENYLNDADYAHLREKAKSIANYRIYYAETPGTVNEIKDTIYRTYDLLKCPLVIFLDHTRLIRQSGKGEKEALEDLASTCISIKKEIKCCIFLISQLNRNIEDPDRVKQAGLHYPQRGDLFGSDALYQAADFVVVAHRPELLNIFKYGPDQMITKDRIFLHILKNRDGDPVIIPMFNNLRINKIDEI